MVLLTTFKTAIKLKLNLIILAGTCHGLVIKEKQFVQ